MRANVAQITGIGVTSIVTLGTDVDVLYAVPLGVFAGALAMFFVAAADARLATRKAPQEAPSAGMLLRDSSSSRKVG